MTVKATRPYAAVQMIDTSVVRVHQHGASVAANSKQLMGRSRGGLTTKIHAVVDGSGLPVRIALTTGETHDNRLVFTLLSGLKSGAMLLADRGFDADWIRGLVTQRGAWANILAPSGPSSRRSAGLQAACQRQRSRSGALHLHRDGEVRQPVYRSPRGVWPSRRRHRQGHSPFGQETARRPREAGGGVDIMIAGVFGAKPNENSPELSGSD